jgi:hypothetical protein
MTKRSRSTAPLFPKVLCPKCITKYPDLMLDKHVKGICEICLSSASYTVTHKIQSYGDNGLNEKPNIQCTNGWN